MPFFFPNLFRMCRVQPLTDRPESALVGGGGEPEAVPGVPLLGLPQERQEAEG